MEDDYIIKGRIKFNRVYGVGILNKYFKNYFIKLIRKIELFWNSIKRIVVVIIRVKWYDLYVWYYLLNIFYKYIRL